MLGGGGMGGWKFKRHVSYHIWGIFLRSLIKAIDKFLGPEVSILWVAVIPIGF